MFCSTCGSSIAPGAAFCPRCGCACSCGSTGGGTSAAAPPFVAAPPLGPETREPFSLGYSWRAFQSFWATKNWDGRATRTEYWSFFLWKFVFQMALSVLLIFGVFATFVVFALAVGSAAPKTSSFEPNIPGTFVSGASSENRPTLDELGPAGPFAAISSFGMFGVFLALQFLFWLAFLIPTLGATIRRLHDANASGAFAALLFLPSVSSLTTLVVGLIDPTPGANQYGPNPRFVPQPPTRPARPTPTSPIPPTPEPTPTRENAENAISTPARENAESRPTDDASTEQIYTTDH